LSLFDSMHVGEIPITVEFRKYAPRLHFGSSSYIGSFVCVLVGPAIPTSSFILYTCHTIGSAQKP
jgi:hypothetical protein